MIILLDSSPGYLHSTAGMLGDATAAEEALESFAESLASAAAACSVEYKKNI